eukprot:TRINITY_DN3891_c0_g1_i1.p1 TRINITY_DN3891_c0_g1~~TRINITY_DN3891_c0_g1_i1.p1  ORF type:complete len:199 (+),score=74.32 TRINITY_DN3891_c0_g1_i1:57-599(+)
MIIAASVGAGLLSEALSWVLIYRTAEYTRLKDNIDRLQKKLDQKKEAVATLEKAKSKDKKIEHYENELKTMGRVLMATKMKSTMAVAVTMIVLYGLLSSSFDGRVVAKLPFEPFGLIRGITHRNLPGTDFTDCSMAFLYLLCSLSLRASMQRFFGHTTPSSLSATNLFAPPDMLEKEKRR